MKLCYLFFFSLAKDLGKEKRNEKERKWRGSASVSRQNGIYDFIKITIFTISLYHYIYLVSKAGWRINFLNSTFQLVEIHENG